MTTLILSFVMIYFFTSCGSTQLKRTIADESWDSLSRETFLRWSPSRLEGLAAASHPGKNCYGGFVDETLEAHKTNYLTQRNHPLYWVRMGNCYFLKDDWRKSEFYYGLALQESSEASVKSIALNNLGVIELKNGLWEKGRDSFLESLKIYQKNLTPLYNLAQLYGQFGLFDEVITLLESPHVRGKKDVDLYFSLANAYLFKGDLKTAKTYFSLLPSDAFLREDIASSYALFLIKEGRAPDALQALNRRHKSGSLELAVIAQQIEALIQKKLKEK